MVALLVIAHGVYGSGQVGNEFPKTSRFKVEHPNNSSTTKQDVIRKEVAVDHTFWQLFLPIFFLMGDFIIQNMADMLQMNRNPATQTLIDAAYTVKGKPVSDRAIIFLANEMEPGPGPVRSFLYGHW